MGLCHRADSCIKKRHLKPIKHLQQALHWGGTAQVVKQKRPVLQMQVLINKRPAWTFDLKTEHNQNHSW